MRHPHPCRESFATDVTKREDQTAVGFFNCEEITRQMTNGEDLARNVERTVMNQTRCTQAPAYFRGLEDRGVQIRVIFLDRKSTRLHSSHLVLSYAVFCL